MLTATLKSLVSRFNLENQKIGEVAAGAVIKHSRDWNLARESTLGSGLHPETPAYDVQRACGTSLTAAVQVAQPHRRRRDRVRHRRRRGQRERHPAHLRARAAEDVLTSVRGSRSSRRPHRRPPATGGLQPSVPGIAEPRTGLSMGQHAEETAKEWRIGRTEQDELAAREPPNAAAAWKAGFFEDLVVPFNDLSATTTYAPTPRSRSSPRCAPRSTALRPARSPPATARRSPTAPRVFCSRRKNLHAPAVSRSFVS